MVERGGTSDTGLGMELEHRRHSVEPMHVFWPVTSGHPPHTGLERSGLRLMVGTKTARPLPISEIVGRGVAWLKTCR